MKSSGIFYGIIGVLLVGINVAPASAGGREVFNGCRGTTSDPCTRHGYCSIQKSDWYQWVDAARIDKYDSQGWAGVCDMAHVQLVQGNCEPFGAQTNLVAYLPAASVARIDGITGSLACGGEAETVEEICGDGKDNNGDGRIDEKRYCR